MDRQHGRRAAPAIFLFAGLLGACASPPTTAPARPTVLVSVPPQAWIVERIAGDLVDVEVMVPPGANPHTYEPTMKQMTAAGRARIYLKVGHPHFTFESAWFDRFAAENRALRVVDGAGGARETGDPHVWLSPGIVRQMGRQLATALGEEMPAARGAIASNLALFERDLDEMDRTIRQTLAPFQGRKFFVFHPAWGYFAESYGLVQVAIEHEGKSPGPDAIAAVIRLAKGERARVIFVEPQNSVQTARVVADAVGAKVVTIDPLARDWAENLRHVSRVLAEALER